MMQNNLRSIVLGVVFGRYPPGIELFPDFRQREPLSDERQTFSEAIDHLRIDDLLSDESRLSLTLAAVGAEGLLLPLLHPLRFFS